MSRRERRYVLPLWTCLLMFGHGCDEGPPAVDSSKTEATVSGVVKVRGVPADGGEIAFNPSNHLRVVPAKTAPIGPDGSFTVTTYTGGNEVSFRGTVATKNRGVGLIKEFVDVKRGENKVEFDLMGQGTRPSIPVPAGKTKGGAG
jgi:hypothetical protein